MITANKATLRYFALFIILSVILATTGCLGSMALKKNKTTLDISKKSIALMTIRSANEVKPKYQLRVDLIHVESGESKKSKRYELRIPYKYVKHQFHEYLVSIALPPGKHKIWLIQGVLRAGAYSGYQLRTDINFNLEPDSIVYLGHLEMVNRLRNEGEAQAARFTSDGSLTGILVGYLSYKTSGLSDGIMELKISDRFDEDIEKFKQHYPALNDYTVKKSIIKPEEEGN